jgi:hypothetical protein
MEGFTNMLTPIGAEFQKVWILGSRILDIILEIAGHFLAKTRNL